MITVIRNSDKTQFVMNAYRELMSLSKKNLLLHKIRLLSELHGRYVCLFKRSRDTLEAVFAKEPGVLLAECVWQHFKEPENLIYCEALPNTRQLLLVIIRDGLVYLSNKIEFNQLRQELTPLMAEQTAYDIYVSGQVPLSDTLTAGSFTFPKEWIRNFRRLSQQLFDELPIAKNVRLQSLPLALREQHLSSPASYVILSAGVLLVLLLVTWIFYPSSNPAPVAVAPPVITRPSHESNGYVLYQRAMQTVSLGQRLSDLSQQIQQLQFAPGWQANQIQFANQQYVIHLTEQGGNLNGLMQWAQSHHYAFNVTNNGAELTQPSPLHATAPAPHHIYPSKQVIVALRDETEIILGSPQAVQLGAPIAHGPVKQTPITIQFSAISPNVLTLLGNRLQHLPVALSAVHVNVAQGVLNGTIQLQAWGT